MAKIYNDPIKHVTKVKEELEKEKKEFLEKKGVINFTVSKDNLYKNNKIS